MNPNAPEHQPGVASDLAIIHIAREKIFSTSDKATARKLNKLLDDTLAFKAVPTLEGVRALEEMTNLRIRARTQNKKKAPAQPLTGFPFFCSTPTPDKSNVCTGVRLDSRQGLRVLNPDAGTPALCTESYLQFICDYANRWHSKLTGIDLHSAGRDPRFFFFPAHQSFIADLMSNSAEKMAKKTSQHLTRAQFWKLRYLFIGINFVPNGQSDSHVALCAIAPEAKTVDYVCSGGDTGLPDSPRSAGSKCVPKLVAWLAAFLHTSFIQYDWRLRVDAGHPQDRNRGDCAIYTVTHAQCLAFGYGLTDSFPPEHQKMMVPRRRRYVQDLMYEGFADFEHGSANTQYYPLLDTMPTALEDDGFVCLPGAVLRHLPADVANKRLCYRDCPSKAALIKHCRRNSTFYPGWNDRKISGRGRTLEELVTWVENMDAKRTWKKSTKAKPLSPSLRPKHHPILWIDPRDPGRNYVFPNALWTRRD
ncbi:hypothetical protein VTL71DRAFT_1096 [Oculimacula yallundae]|uniref:Ubiquitin-like protease family profile domain-containing protein n=1 Tax=Oculimacula yallundae TaxID=86028 RepID=A0ABR4D1W3_9HELO